MASCLQVEGLTKSFGDRVLFENISFGIADGERIGLIAKNGTGKTTLLNIIGGKEVADTGNVVFRRDLRVGYLEQDPHFPEGSTVLQACFHSENQVVALIASYEEALEQDDHQRMTELLDQMDAHKAWEYEQQVKQILSQLKITHFDQPVSQLSGGQLKRVALANILITAPDLLILDEPTNHLDLEMTEWLEGYLNRNNISLLMVTHDRYFLDRVCNEIIEIDNRTLYAYKGNYSYYLEKRAERISIQNSEIDRANNLMRKELDWMRRQPQARATKAKYRKEAFYKLQEKARGTRQEGEVRLSVKASYIGSKICEIEHLSKAYGEKKLLEDFSYIFARYEKLGIVGRNGTGKSTFIKMLLGKVQPDRGSIDIGETVRFGYYSQEGLQFDDSMKVIDAVQAIAEEISLGDGQKLSASQFLQHFLFAPEVQHNYIAKLSGGERRRLYLCTVLIQNPNFLVLDEPTNDLDIVTLNLLEEYLCAFKGCVIVVSHDRYFMDKVVDHLLVFEGEAQLRDFPGGYTDYRDWREEREKEEHQQVVSTKVRAPKPEKEQVVSKDTKPTRLTFKERKELEALDEELPQLNSRKTDLEAAMNSGTLSTDELFEKSKEISVLLEAIDEKEMRWLELSERA